MGGREIGTVLRRPPTHALSKEDVQLLWRFRFSLMSNKHALTKFLRCVDWSDAKVLLQYTAHHKGSSHSVRHTGNLVHCTSYSYEVQWTKFPVFPRTRTLYIIQGAAHSPLHGPVTYEW